MKKRVLSVLLIIALLVAVGIVAAQAEETEPTIAEIKADAQAVIDAAETLTIDPANPKAVCPVCGEEKTWIAVPVNGAANSNYFLGNAHYYIPEDMTLPFQLQKTGDTPCLFLNNKTITVKTSRFYMGGGNIFGNGNIIADLTDDEGAPNGKTIEQLINANGGTLNIYGGTYSVANAPVAATDTTTATQVTNMMFGNTSNFVYNIYGGRFDATNTANYNTQVYNGANFNMYGGQLSGKRFDTGTSMWGVANVGIYGGTLDCEEVYAMRGDITVQGGSIKKLRVTTTGSYTISGNPKIELLDLTSASTKKPTVGTLTEGASIGLGTYTGVITQAFETETAAKAAVPYFKVDTGMEVSVNADLTLSYGKRTTPYTPAEIVALSKEQSFGSEAVPVEKYCYACNKTVTWQPLTGPSSVYTGVMANDGHYFLANDIINYPADATAGTTNFGACLYFNKQVGTRDAHIYCIHLNGKTIDQQASDGNAAIRIWTQRQTVNIMGNGIVTGKTGGSRGILNMDGASIVNIYGGTYSALNSDKNAIANRAADAVVNVYGGEIDSGSYFNTTAGITTIAGGTFNYGDFRGGTVTVTGGSITTLRTMNTADVTISGGNVTTLNSAAATVTLQGGNVATANISGTAVATLSGAPTIGALNATVAVNAKALTGGSIGLGTTDGVFTTAFDSKADAEAAIPYFVAEDGMAVTVTEDFELTYGARKYTPDEIIVEAKKQSFTVETVDFCYHCGKNVTWKPFTEEMAVKTNTISGHYFLAFESDTYASNVSTKNIIPIDANGDICLHLNGKSWTATNTAGNDTGLIRFSTGANGAIMGNGTIHTFTQRYIHIPDSSTATGKTYNIYGGTYQASSTSTSVGWALGMIAGSGSTNIYDGTFLAGKYPKTAEEQESGNYTGGYSATIVCKKTGVLNLEGGTFNCTRLESDYQMNIGGGTFNAYLIAAGGSEITINGGIFNNYMEAGSSTGVGYGVANTTGTIEINGGTINHQVRVTGGYGLARLLGGTYTKDLITDSGLRTVGPSGTTGGTIEIDGANLPYHKIQTGGTTTNNIVFKSGSAYLIEVTKSNADVKISGGTVDKLTVKDGTVALVDAPTVGAIDLAEGKVLDLNGMTGGSLNVGNFDGVFTTKFADAAAAAAAEKFVNSPTKAISVDETNFVLFTEDGNTVIVNDDSQKAYATYAEAEAAYDGGHIKLLSDDPIEITKDVTIDLNGQNVTISGTGTLTGLDSTTKDKFSKAPATADIDDAIEVTTPAPTTANDGTVSGYIATTDNGFTSFSYYKMKLSGVALKAKKDAEGNLSDVGMYYKGTWSFNDYLPAGQVEAGVIVNIGEHPLVPGDDYNGWYSIDATAITNGEPMTSVLVDGIMTADEAKYNANTSNGQTAINAAAFITINGETNIITGAKSLSVRDVLYAIETNADALAANEGKLYGEGKFYALWTPYVNFATWNLPEYTARFN